MSGTGFVERIRSVFRAGTTWVPRDQTAAVAVTGQRLGLNVACAVSPRGELRFMIFKERMNRDKFIDFQESLIHNAEQPIFLIVDGRPWHRARKVLGFVESTEGRLRMFMLPPSSLELDPDELRLNHLKNHAVGKKTSERRLKQIALGPL